MVHFKGLVTNEEFEVTAEVVKTVSTYAKNKMLGLAFEIAVDSVAPLFEMKCVINMRDELL